MKKQAGRLGGRLLSLGASANSKSNNTHYNPAQIKKQKEFYKNAKCIKKYKKLNSDHESGQTRTEWVDLLPEEGDKTRRKQRKRSDLQSLRAEYEKKKQEEEKLKMEAEAARQAQKAEREKIMAQKKERKHKMFKKTSSGQPIMKYRLDHLIESLQNSSK